MNAKLLSVAALLISAAATNAYAANGKISFTGEIVKSTCTVNSTDQNKEVAIGKYPTSTFTNVDDTSPSKAFAISLEKCEAGDYTLQFEGATVTGHSDLLAVSGGAAGVGIEITTTDDKVVPINQSGDNTPTVTVATSADNSGTATFNLKAHYKSYDQTITPGSANANVTFTIAYK